MTDPKPIKSPKPTATEPVTGPAAPAPSVAPDEHHGRGGMYTVANGQRVLVERTQAEHEIAAEATQPATPVNPPATTE